VFLKGRGRRHFRVQLEGTGELKEADDALVGWQQWARQPQRVWLRRVAFQVHQWIGLAIGLYVVVLSITGSVLVYRNELDRYFATPRAPLRPGQTPLTAEAIKASAERQYPGWTVTHVTEGRYEGRGRRRPDPTASVTLERGGDRKDRLFDPYTGADLGDSTTRGQFFLLWLVRVHDELLLDRPDGPWWNGLLSLVFTLLVLTGAVVWWPGVSRWRRSLGVRWSAGWRRITWDLHSALGFWLLPFMLMWGVSGWYLGMPEPLTELVDWISDPEGAYGERPGDVALMWLSRLHFGRWRDPVWGPALKALWAAAGLVPAILFVTGVVMWWNRVVRRRAAREEAAVA
jgi:uncharacterized iron-regulated membrane protein